MLFKGHQGGVYGKTKGDLTNNFGQGFKAELLRALSGHQDQC